MKILAGYAGCLTLELHPEEATLIDNLVGQLIELFQSHSGTGLDPDPLLASLEVGGSSRPPEDPALARLFPDAFDASAEASAFRQVTEQGLINRKLQDATTVVLALGLEAPQRAEDRDPDAEAAPVRVTITAESLPPWVRTLTALRLAMAARLGIVSADDQDRLAEDPDSRSTLLVFDWLAAVVDSILQFESVLDGTDEDEPQPA